MTLVCEIKDRPGGGRQALMWVKGANKFGTPAQKALNNYRWSLKKEMQDEYTSLVSSRTEHSAFQCRSLTLRALAFRSLQNAYHLEDLWETNIPHPGRLGYATFPATFPKPPACYLIRRDGFEQLQLDTPTGVEETAELSTFSATEPPDTST